MSSTLFIAPTGESAAAGDHVLLSDSSLLENLRKIADSSISGAKTTGFLPDDDVLEQIFRVLVPRAKVSFEGCFPDREAGQNFAIGVKLLGFIDIMAAKDPGSNERFVVCQKPDWTSGASASIQVTSTQPIKTKWKMATDDLAEDELVDESALLNDGLDKKAISGCSGEEVTLPSGRKACKNCTCGLAEEEAGAAKVEKKESKSSCGNCAKGDAFRCASCPYLGTPAFEPGQEKVVLASLADDI